MKFFKFYAAFFFLCLTSCATTLNVQVQRPAKIDLNGAKTIAVLPFKPSQLKRTFDVFSFIVDPAFLDYEKFNPDERRCIEKLKYEIEDGLAKSPYISLVDFSEVRKSVKNKYISPADVYIAGEISYFCVDDVKNEVRHPVSHYVIDEEGNKKEIVEYESVFEFSRSATLVFNYKVVNSADSKILANGSIELSNRSGRYDSKMDLPSAYSLLQYRLNDAATKILQEIQPYVVTKYVKLLKDKSKNPDMKKADKLAKDSRLNASFDEFLRIYDSTGLFEAGYNAAILKEALGDLFEAEKIMNELYRKTSDDRALKILNDIKNEIYQAERLKKQIETKDEFLDF